MTILRESWSYESPQKKSKMRKVITIFSCILLVSIFTDASDLPHLRPITGSISQPFGDHDKQLYVVAYGRDGSIYESAPVTTSAKFSFFTLRKTPGDYVLHLRGAELEEYNSILIRINSKNRVAYVYVRKNTLTLPPARDQDFDDEDMNEDLEILFKPSGKSFYARKQKSWSLWDLWAYKYRVLQGLVLLFIVSFPQVIQSLPKEMREELTGEKEPDMSNANDIYNILSAKADSSQSNRKRS